MWYHLGYISLIFYGSYFASIFLLAFLHKHFASGTLLIGLYREACDCRHSQVPAQKLQKEKCTQDQQLLQSAPPPKDEYLEETQPRQTLIMQDNSSLLAPQTIDEPEYKETSTPMERPEPIAEAIPEGDIIISQVTPLLGTTPRENTQLWCQNTPEDISDILGTRGFQR